MNMNKMILCVGLVLHAQAVVAGDTPTLGDQLRDRGTMSFSTSRGTDVDKVAKRTSKTQLYFMPTHDTSMQFFLSFEEFKGKAGEPGAPRCCELKWENDGEVCFRSSSVGSGYISETPTQRPVDQKPLVKEILNQAESFTTDFVLAKFKSVEQLSSNEYVEKECLIPLLEFKELLQAAMAPVATKPTPSVVAPKTGDTKDQIGHTPKKSILPAALQQQKELTSVEPTSFFSNMYVKIGGVVTLAGALALFCYFKYIAAK